MNPTAAISAWQGPRNHRTGRFLRVFESESASGSICLGCPDGDHVTSMRLIKFEKAKLQENLRMCNVGQRAFGQHLGWSVTSPPCLVNAGVTWFLVYFPLIMFIFTRESVSMQWVAY